MGELKINKTPKVNVDILVVRGGKVLLGLLSDEWKRDGKPTWGVPGSDIGFGEKIGDAVKRHIKKELGADVTGYKIIAVNANYALGNHYIGIGIAAEIVGEPEILMPDEWKEWRWVSLDRLPDSMFPPAKNLIECYLSGKVNVSE